MGVFTPTTKQSPMRRTKTPLLSYERQTQPMKNQGFFIHCSTCWLKQKYTPESHESNCIWGKMKSTVWETAPQIALTNYSKDGQYICDFVEGVYIYFAHIFLFKNQAHIFWMFLLLTRNSYHHGFQCFSTCEETQKLGS